MCNQVWVKCTRCGRVFIRYDYGKGKKRVKKPHNYGHSHQHCPPKTTDTCIFCRGKIEVLGKKPE